MARLILKKTCTSHPEQYDVYKGSQRVAYFRLRNGLFTASVPSVGGDIVYQSLTFGDGMFAHRERHSELSKACSAVLSHLRLRPNEELYVIEKETQ